MRDGTCARPGACAIPWACNPTRSVPAAARVPSAARPGRGRAATADRPRRRPAHGAALGAARWCCASIGLYAELSEHIAVGARIDHALPAGRGAAVLRRGPGGGVLHAQLGRCAWSRRTRRPRTRSQEANRDLEADRRRAHPPPARGDRPAGDRQRGPRACQPGAAPAGPDEVGVRVARVAPAAGAADQHHRRPGDRVRGRRRAAAAPASARSRSWPTRASGCRGSSSASSTCRAWTPAGCRIHLGPVALEPLLARAAESTLGVAERTPCVARWMRRPALPPAWADEQLLGRWCATSLENAVRYAPADRPVDIDARGCGWADARDRRRGRRAQACRADEQARIFESFHRVGDADASVAGHGLGLYFADRLIRAQHGAIGVQSPLRPGAESPGSRFWVRLPIAAAARTRTTRRPGMAGGARPELMARIVLVDDDRSLLELLGDYLGRLGPRGRGHPRRRPGTRPARDRAGRPGDPRRLDAGPGRLAGAGSASAPLSRVPVIMLTARVGRAGRAARLRGRRRRLRDQAVLVRAARRTGRRGPGARVARTGRDRVACCGARTSRWTSTVTSCCAAASPWT